MKKLFWVSPIALATVGFLAACGDDSSSSSGPATQPSVDKFADLDECTAENEGDKVLVKDSETTYVCSDGDWTEVTEEEKSDAKDDDSKDKKDSKDDDSKDKKDSKDDDSSKDKTDDTDSEDIDDSGDEDEGEVYECGDTGVEFNTKDQFCYSGVVYDRCNGDMFDAGHEKCDNGKIVPASFCGGTDEYDPEKQFCLYGTIYDLCGGKTFNPSGETCVDGKLKTKAWCGGKQEYYTDEKFCVDDKTLYDLCGGEEYDPTKKKCSDGKVTDKAFCADKEYDADKQFCLDEKTIYDLCGGKEYNPEEEYCTEGKTNTIDTETEFIAKKGGVVDRVYKKVTIGTQTWMAENLKYATGTSWCLNDNAGKCEVNGRLYEFETAKAACPDGWHLPSKAEWETLIAEVGGLGNADKALAATSWGGKDTYGFSATATGRNIVAYSRNNFKDANAAFFWSSTTSNVYAYYLTLGGASASLRADEAGYQFDAGMAVRCVQNADAK